MRISDPIELKYPARLLRLLLLEERGLPLLGIQGVMQRPPSHLLGHLQVRTPGHQLPWKARTALLKVLHKANPKEFYVRTVRGGHNSIWFSCFFSYCSNIHIYIHVRSSQTAKPSRAKALRWSGESQTWDHFPRPTALALRWNTAVLPLLQRKLHAKEHA